MNQHKGADLGSQWYVGSYRVKILYLFFKYISEVYVFRQYQNYVSLVSFPMLSNNIKG